MVMRMLRRRNMRAAATPAGGLQPPPVEHPSRTLTMTVPEGAGYAERVIIFSEEIWRANLVALDIEYLESAGQLMCRINDSPPTGVGDVRRGDVRVVHPLSYAEIRGPVVESLGVRLHLDEAVEAGAGDFLARFQLRGWSQPR